MGSEVALLGIVPALGTRSMSFGSFAPFDESDGLSEAKTAGGGVGNGAGTVCTPLCTPSTDDNDAEWRWRTLVPVVTREGDKGT